jgi:hypothetical protein
MINQRFARWTIINKIEGHNKNNRYVCRCDCGNEANVFAFTLRNGTSTQCNSCRLKKGHNQSNTSTYNIWSGLFTRCYNKNHITYKYYGAKGITVSEDWKTFEKFFEDMGERPTGYQIDRIDNTKGYCKDNCRWLSKTDNLKRQHNRLIDIAGMKFGKWTVFDRDIMKLDKDQAYWNCVCDCGTERSIIGSFLRSGDTKQRRDCKDEAHRGWGDRLKMKDRNNER